MNTSTPLWWRLAWIRCYTKGLNARSSQERLDAIRSRLDLAIMRHRNAVRLRDKGGAK